jgi:carbohydrate kinase (thermoresistant glucokinase family)
MSAPWRVVLMGVAGSGKSAIGAALAERRHARLIGGDDFHPASNIEKMVSGTPLTQDDHWPWLAALRHAMRNEHQVVVTCSPLKRIHRDALRRAGNVRFVYLVVDPRDARQRLASRSVNFMAPEMVESPFEALEPPGEDETDVTTVRSTGEIITVLDEIESVLATLPVGTSTAPLRSEGNDRREFSVEELRRMVGEIVATELVAAKRVLLVPPDSSRLHSRAGVITGLLYQELTAGGAEVAVLPALGTHSAVTADEAELLFDRRVPFERIRQHKWRDGVTRLGEISAAEVAALSGSRMSGPIPVEVDNLLLSGWNVVVSVGQVVPHEVIGMANYSKNLIIGLGGASTINRSHFLSAICGMENVIGRADNPVRDLVDAAFDRFLAPRVSVLWILTVVQDTAAGTVHRGFFVGRGRSGESGGAAYRAAADLAARCNIDVLPQPLCRVACWLNPDEFKTTWTANKAIYRTRMAMADDGELIVLAPAVSRFGEDAFVDALIRRHGYRGTSAAFDAIPRDPELAKDLGVAAHLVSGSSEGRFRIVYCTDPAAGGLTREEVEGVGYEWRSLPVELSHLGVTSKSATGLRRDRSGTPFYYIANPALGLWTASSRFQG